MSVEGIFLGLSLYHGWRLMKDFKKMQRIIISDNIELLFLFLRELTYLLDNEKVSIKLNEDNVLWNSDFIVDVNGMHKKLESKITSFEPLGKETVNLIGRILERFEKIKEKPVPKSFRKSFDLEPMDYDIMFPDGERIEMINSLLEQIENLKEKLYNSHNISTIRY